MADNYDRWTHTFSTVSSVNGVGVKSVPDQTGVHTSEWQFKSGIGTPGYFKTIQDGNLLPDTMYTRRSSKNVSQTGYRQSWYYQCYGGARIDYTGEIRGNLSLVDCDSITASRLLLPTEKAILVDNRAKAGLLDKVKDQKVNLAQAMAERKQTAKLIGDSAFAVADALRNLKRGNLAGAAAALGLPPPSKRAAGKYKKQIVDSRRRKSRKSYDKALSKGVLSVQYGWRPLLNDVYGSLEALEKREHRDVIRHVKSCARISHEADVKSIVGYSDVHTRASVNRLVCYKATFVQSVSIERSMASVGVTNPALVAWELVPWSFVVDWFLPVGNYLSTLDATLGLDFLGGSVSTKTYGSTVLSQTWNRWNFGESCYSTKYTGEAEASDEFKALTRVPLGGFPLPSLPSFKNPLSLEHALNAISLLSQLRKV